MSLCPSAACGGVRSVYTVGSVCGTLCRFRGAFTRMRSVAVGRTVLLYYLGSKRAGSTNVVYRCVNLSGSHISGIVATMRGGNCVHHGVGGGSGQRVYFSLAPNKGRGVRRVVGTRLYFSKLFRGLGAYVRGN